MNQIKPRIIYALIICLISLSAAGQKKFTISGYVKDAKTGEELIGATIIINEMQATGASTNAYGFYSITIPEGKYTVTSQFIGYASQTMELTLSQNIKQDFVLEEKTSQLKEVVVTGERKDENITNTQMGANKISIKEIENIPVIFGEKDVLKTLQLTPGIKTAGEGSSGFYVRGGSADQNLILLDEATVYNASHLLGFFSVFNSDAIKDIMFYKGTQPAEFGGRLSSVLDIKMQDGNDRKYGVEGGIGIISSRLKVEGPIVKERGSFTVSGRRTYADLFLKLSKDTSLNKTKLYFYDINAKANYEINGNNKLFLSGYFGRDVLGFGTRFGIDWGNATATLRWNHLYSEKLFSNTSVIFSNYNYKIHVELSTTKAQIISRLQDWNLKQDYQYFINSKNNIRFGFNSIYHKIIPGVVTRESDSTIHQLNLTNKFSWENALYISHEFKTGKKFSIEYGLRLSSFSAMGPGDFFTYDAQGNTTDTATYSKWTFVRTFINPEPRVTMDYVINAKSSVKAAYTRNVQNLHLISNSTTSSPTDMWIPSSNNVKPEISDQISLGYFRNFKDNRFEFSTEVYYKFLQNQVDYKDGAQTTLNENVESQLLFGTGRAYGVELFFKKKYGKLTGWVGYTLSRTEKKIVGVNNGAYYPAKQDRTHDVSIVLIWDISKKWNVSATWVYYTGDAVTFPSGKYQVAGNVVNYYTERNGYRMPAYHRLDVGATWQIRKNAKSEQSLNISCYNAYGRENAYQITFQQDPNDPSKTQSVQTTLFRWVPSLTYNFKF